MTAWAREVFIDLDVGIRIRYNRDERPPIHYAIVLEAWIEGRWTAIRLWDNAHGLNEHHEHAYTANDGKCDPIVRFFDSVNQAMAAAIACAGEDWPAILESWRS